jgi:hypothetical protein
MFCCKQRCYWELTFVQHPCIYGLQMQQLGVDHSRLAAEKADLENALEAEQEYIMHKLHRQVRALAHQPRGLVSPSSVY